MKTRVAWSIILFFLSFIVYNSNGSLLWNAEMYDTIGTKLLPFSILTGKAIFLDEFADAIYKDTDAERYFIRSDGHALPWSPVLSGILVTPLYAPYVLWANIQGLATTQAFYAASFALEKLSASFFASISVVLMYWFLLRTFGKGNYAVLGSVLFAFGTQQWSTSSQFLWSHGPATLLFLVSQLLFLKGSFVASLLVAILVMFTRYPLAAYPVLLAIMVSRKDRCRAGLYALIVALALGGLLIKHFALYGNLFGPYDNRIETFGIRHFVPNLAGILFSPGRGIIWYTPFVLWALVKPKTLFSRFHAAFVAFMILGISTWNVWWGGASFGDRLLADIGVSVVFLALSAYQRISSPFLRGAFWVAAVWSIVIHGLGAFSLGVDAWNIYPVSIDQKPARVWNIRDTPISRILAVGFPRYGWYRVWYWYKGITERTYDPADRVCTLRVTGLVQSFGYKKANISFTNRSSVAFVTSGTNILRLRSIFRNRQTGEVVTSPIADTGLPAVIEPGQTVNTSLVLIPPDRGEWKAMIVPVQEGYSWWGTSCSGTVEL